MAAATVTPAATKVASTPSFGKFLGAGASLFGGVTSYASGMESASLLNEQGSLSRDDYYRQAALVLDQGYRVRSKQTMEYVSAGVEIAGTPQLVLKETMMKTKAQVAAYQVTGNNVENLYRKKAQQAKSEGMSSLVSGILIAGALLI